MNSVLDNFSQSSILHSPLLPPVIVVGLITLVFLSCFRKPKQPTYALALDDFTSERKQKKKAVKSEKKTKAPAAKSQPTKAASVSSKAAAVASPAAGAGTVSRPSPSVAHRPETINASTEESGDWFEVTSSGKRKVAKANAKASVSGPAADPQPGAKAEAKIRVSDKSTPTAAKAAVSETRQQSDSKQEVKAKKAESKKSPKKSPEAKASPQAAGASKDAGDKSGADKDAANKKTAETKDVDKEAQPKIAADSKAADKPVTGGKSAGKAERKAGGNKAAAESPAEVRAEQPTAVGSSPAAADASLNDSGLGDSFVEVKPSQLKRQTKGKPVEVDGFVLAEYSPPSSASVSPPISQQSDTVQLEAVRESPPESDEAAPSRTSGSAKKKLKRMQKQASKGVAEATAPAPPSAPAAAATAVEPAWVEVPTRKRRARREN